MNRYNLFKGNMKCEPKLWERASMTCWYTVPAFFRELVQSWFRLLVINHSHRHFLFKHLQKRMRKNILLSPSPIFNCVYLDNHECKDVKDIYTCQTLTSISTMGCFTLHIYILYILSYIGYYIVLSLSEMIYL